MTVNPVRTQGVVHNCVKDGFVVVCPYKRRDPVDGNPEVFSGFEVADLEYVLGKGTGFVIGVCCQFVVGAYCVSSKAVGAFALGHVVHIKDNLFGGLHAACPAAVDSVLFARLCTGVVEVAVLQDRVAFVLLFDPPQYLFVNGILQGKGSFHYCLGVFILGIEVIDHARGVLAADPVIIVNPFGPELLESLRFLFCIGWCREIVLCSHFCLV
ncbi:hypothetical protein SDC9_149177 [bioreactor metagenome]|uniref:Uncharacterized protein n=1 Tax=bioreactor metagenome TaxID=1076179 RepID=A0A645EMS9_9ZZZZ